MLVRIGKSSHCIFPCDCRYWYKYCWLFQMVIADKSRIHKCSIIPTISVVTVTEKGTNLSTETVPVYNLFIFLLYPNQQNARYKQVLLSAKFFTIGFPSIYGKIIQWQCTVRHKTKIKLIVSAAIGNVVVVDDFFNGIGPNIFNLW
jgi:hypothetical protein